MKIPVSRFPRDISEDEADLGFQQLVVQGMEAETEFVHLFKEPAPPAIVARILSPHELLLKDLALDDEVEYCHFRFGYSTMGKITTETDWSPIGSPHKSAAEFLQDYGVGTNARAIEFPGAPFTMVKFNYRAASLEDSTGRD